METKLTYTIQKQKYKKRGTNKFKKCFPYYYVRFIESFLKQDPLFIEENGECDYSTNNSLSKLCNGLKSVKLTFLISKISTSIFFKDKYYIPETWNKNKKYKKNKLWYCKPDRGSGGKNIIVTDQPYKIDNKKYVIQESINMKNINGRRWDCRIFVIHRICNDHFETWLYYDGGLRFSSGKKNESLKYMITNTSQYSEEDNPDKLNSCFTKLPRYNIYLQNLQEVLKDIHHEFANKLKFKNIKKNQFQLFGYDFVFCKDDTPKMLEINTKPHTYRKKENGFSHGIETRKMMYKMYLDLYHNFIRKTLLNDNNLDTNFICIASNKIDYQS